MLPVEKITSITNENSVLNMDALDFNAVRI